jgi:hypothetical protein
VPPAHTVWFYQSELPTVDETQQCGRAVFDVHHLTAERVRIGVTGDIDATNRQALGRFVERHTRASQQIVLDLKQSRLFGSQGFTPLYYVNVHCGRRDVDWISSVIERWTGFCGYAIATPSCPSSTTRRCGGQAGSLHEVPPHCVPGGVNASVSGSMAAAHRQAASLQNRPPPGDCNPGSGDVAALVGRQKDINRCEPGGLGRPAQRSVLAERSDLFRRHR